VHCSHAKRPLQASAFAAAGDDKTRKVNPDYCKGRRVSAMRPSVKRLWTPVYNELSVASYFVDQMKLPACFASTAGYSVESAGEMLGTAQRTCRRSCLVFTVSKTEEISS